MNCLSFYRSEEARKAGVKLGVPRPSDAGFDIPCLMDVELKPRAVTLVQTGIHLGIPSGWVGIVKDRSSVAMKGVTTLAGVIDASYRGELKVAMFNLTDEVKTFKCGERIAQLVVVQHLEGGGCEEVEELGSLGETERGSGGFGSTGK